MTSMTVDPRLKWEPPHKRPCEGDEDGFMNQMERDFIQFLDDNCIKWEYEPRFYYIETGDRPKGQHPRGYCRDIYLPEYDVGIEIYEATDEKPGGDLSPEQLIKARKRRHRGKSELRRRKQQRIHLLSRYSGWATVLIHPDNWSIETADWAEVERLIHRAIIAAMVQRFSQIISPQTSHWEV